MDQPWHELFFLTFALLNNLSWIIKTKKAVRRCCSQAGFDPRVAGWKVQIHRPKITHSVGEEVSL